LVIWGHYSNVSFKNLTIRMKPAAEGVCVRLEAPRDVLFDGFTASGGYALLGTYDNQAEYAKHISFSNGAYHGPALVSQNETKIDDLDIQPSVRLDSGVVPTTP
jgi:hypothetical protein